MMKLYLVRHGRVAWNINNSAYSGWTDLPLDEVGEAQAVRIGERLGGEKISAVYTSDRSRAISTAEQISRRLGVPAIVVPRLREINYGEWEGMSPDDIRIRYGRIYEDWLLDAEQFAPPGGETLAELLARVLPAIDEIVERHPGESVAVVAHKTVNRTLICHWLGMPVARYWEIGQDNTSLNIIRLDGNRAVLETVNDICHTRR
jgi:alpha-ribazole phosphatase